MAGGSDERPGESPADIVQGADGRRSVRLLIPFTVTGIRTDVVTFAPCTFGHLLRWQAGKFDGGIALLMELTGLTFGQIEALRQPDDGRVMDAMLSHVHPDIAADLREGKVPLNAFDAYGAPAAASGRPPAAEAGIPAPADVDQGGAPYGGFVPDWAGVEAVGERPTDYVPGIDD